MVCHDWEYRDDHYYCAVPGCGLRIGMHSAVRMLNEACEREVRLREALLAVEWRPSIQGYPDYCTYCGAHKPGPHESDCPVGAALASADAPDEQQKATQNIPELFRQTGERQKRHDEAWARYQAGEALSLEEFKAKHGDAPDEGLRLTASTIGPVESLVLEAWGIGVRGQNERLEDILKRAKAVDASRRSPNGKESR